MVLNILFLFSLQLSFFLSSAMVDSLRTSQLASKSVTLGPSSAPTFLKSSFRPTSGPTMSSQQEQSDSSSIQSRSGFLAIYIDVPIAFLILLVIFGYCYFYRSSKKSTTNGATTPRDDAAVFSFGNLYPGRDKGKETTVSNSHNHQNPLLSRMLSGTAKPISTASNSASQSTLPNKETGKVQRVVQAIETNQFATQAQPAASSDLYEDREGPIGKKFGPIRPESKPILIVPDQLKEGAPDTLPLTGLSSGDVCTLLESIGMYKAVAEFGKRDITGYKLSEMNDVEDFAKFEVTDVPEPILKALLVKLSTYKVDGVPSKLVL